MAPRKVIHTNSQRETSSDTVMPELKPYRSTTLPNTITTMTASMAAITPSSPRQYHDSILVIVVSFEREARLRGGL